MKILVSTKKNIENILDKFDIEDQKQLFIKIGSGLILSSQVIDAMFPDKAVVKQNNKIVILNKVKKY